MLPFDLGGGPKRGAYSKSHHRSDRPPFDCVALLLQGGGALGAYQAGVYEALAEARLQPDWVAGISIGAINSALIAGNPPETRVDSLRRFWELVSRRDAADLLSWFARGECWRSVYNQWSAGSAVAFGVPGFFLPHAVTPWLSPDGSNQATSYYDTGWLKSTLERLVDFDRINGGETRLSVGAVNVRSGNFVYFDSGTHCIRAEHIMASGALPPGFPPIEIEGEHYWDGGLVSNTPLQWLLETSPPQDSLIFQVDLWSAKGGLPRNMPEVMTRQKEIQYSSRTRANTDWFRKIKRIRLALATLLDKVPEEIRSTPEATLLRSVAERNVCRIVHLIYRAKNYEGQFKDCEFSRASMEEHWRAGYYDAVRTLRHSESLRRPDPGEGISTFDLAIDGRE